ncbi:hypothetical protein M3651_09125 [Cytobacillus oceanisediminis]|nr:hypothetical protein [Cytobacillus oceanisediminis]
MLEEVGDREYSICSDAKRMQQNFPEYRKVLYDLTELVWHGCPAPF